METTRGRRVHTGLLAGSSTYELLRSVRSRSLASSRCQGARPSSSSLCGVCGCHSALSFSRRNSRCFAGLSAKQTSSFSSSSSSSSSSLFPFCASFSPEGRLSDSLFPSLRCDFPSRATSLSFTSSSSSSRRSSLSSFRSTPSHKDSWPSPICAAPAQRCPRPPLNRALASRTSQGIVLCTLLIVALISQWMSRNHSVSYEFSRPWYFFFSSPVEWDEWKSTAARGPSLRCKYTPWSPEGPALSSSFHEKTVSSDAHSISLYPFSERASHRLDLSLPSLLFAEGVAVSSPARSRQVNFSLRCPSLPSFLSEKGTRPGLLARRRSLLGHLSYSFPHRDRDSSRASLSSSLSSSSSSATAEGAPLLLGISYTAKRRFFRTREESQRQGMLSTSSSPFSHSSLSCSPSLVSSSASPRPSTGSAGRVTRTLDSSFFSSNSLSSSRLSEIRRLFSGLSPLGSSPSVSSRVLASVPPFPLSDTLSSPSSGAKQSSSSLRSSSSSSSAVCPPATSSSSLSTNSSPRSSRSPHSCYTQASARPLSQATSLSSPVSTSSSEFPPLSVSTSSPQSASSSSSPDKPCLTIIVKTAIGSPYIDVSYRLLLPLSSTFGDLQQALQIEILKQQQKYLDLLAGSSPSASFPKGNRHISSTSSFSQEKNSSTSSSSSVVPPPIELLRLLYGGAPVTDPDLRLMTLLPQHLRGEDMKPKVLVFLLDLPTPPFFSPSLSDRNAGVLSSSSPQQSPSPTASSLTSSPSSLEALAAHAAAFEQDALILRRLQETLRSLDERTQPREGSFATEETWKKDSYAIGEENEDEEGEREKLSQETLEYAIWGNKHALPLQSSEEIHRRVSTLTSRYQPKEKYTEPPSACYSATQPSLVQEDARSLPVQSSVSTSFAGPDVFFEFPQLAPTFGARLKQNLKVEVDVDWAWILKLGLACTAVQFLIGKGKETEEENKTPVSSSSSPQTSGGPHVLLRGIQKLFFSGTANKWRKRALLSVAPVVVLSSWRPVRFARKVFWYSLPRGKWWAVASPILTRHRESMLTLDESGFFHSLEDDKKEQ